MRKLNWKKVLYLNLNTNTFSTQFVSFPEDIEQMIEKAALEGIIKIVGVL